MLSQVVELIENKDNFAITTHVRPDGDGIGSSLGLDRLLAAMEQLDLLPSASTPAPVFVAFFDRDHRDDY